MFMTTTIDFKFTYPRNRGCVCTARINGVIVAWAAGKNRVDARRNMEIGQ